MPYFFILSLKIQTRYLIMKSLHFTINILLPRNSHTNFCRFQAKLACANNIYSDQHGYSLPNKTVVVLNYEKGMAYQFHQPTQNAEQYIYKRCLTSTFNSFQSPSSKILQAHTTSLILKHVLIFWSEHCVIL
jgi:hypothetical protein